MNKRYDSIGIKQTIRIEWLDKTVNLLLSGLDNKTIRAELHEYMTDKNADGSIAIRSENTRGFVVINLMNIWVTTPKEIVPLRDDALKLIKEKPDLIHVMHWAMLCAVYPFWYNTAVQIGRLLNLQDEITKQQIISRLKEKYGDREVINRYSQFVILAFGYWNILEESERKGCYIQSSHKDIVDTDAAALLFEAILLAQKERKSTISDLKNSPGLFPFKCPSLTGSQIVSLNTRLSISAFSTGDEYIFINQ